VGCALVHRSMLTAFIVLLAPLDARAQVPAKKPSSPPTKQAPAPAAAARPRTRKGSNTPWARAPGWSLWHPLHLKAKQHYTEGDYQRAQLDLEQIVADCGKLNFGRLIDKNEYIKDTWEKMPAEGEINRFLEADNFGILGCAHAAQGHYYEAEHYFSESVAYIKGRAGDQWSINTGITSQRMAFLLAARGRYREAEDLERRALTHVETIHPGQQAPPPPSGVAMILVALADIDVARGRLAAADRCLRRAGNIQAIQRQLGVGPTAEDQAAFLCVSALLRHQQGRSSEAYNLWGQAMELIRTISNDNPLEGYPLDGMAEVELLRGDLGPAEEHFRKALTVRENALGKRHREVAYSLDGLGRVAVARGEREAAVRAFQQASSILDEALGTDHPDTAKVAEHAKILDRPGTQQGDPAPKGARFLAIPTLIVLGWWYSYAGSDWVSLEKALEKKEAKALKKENVQPARPLVAGAKVRKLVTPERQSGALVRPSER
jgi:tetratricopeptide (TPR) repeat protein